MLLPPLLLLCGWSGTRFPAGCMHSWPPFCVRGPLGD